MQPSKTSPIRFIIALYLVIPLIGYGQIDTKPIINATIYGRIIDSIDRVPIAGASVQLEGVTHTVVTEKDGSFRFVTGQQLPATVLIKSIGYESRTVVISHVPFDIALPPLLNQFDDVVVTGYAAQSRRLYTGAASQIKSEALENRPAQSFDQLLGGQAAGVNIVQPSGALNATPVFRIRGINSITSSVYPLIIVDGVTVFTGSAGGDVGNNPLANINPADIESMDVLKDASASAIYGSRAANGVLIITTKKGKLGKPAAGYNNWLSISRPFNLPSVLGVYDYIELKNEARVNAGLSPGFVLGTDAQGNVIRTDWYDVAYQTAVSQNHHLYLSGATPSTSYYASANFTDQNGIVRTNKFQQKGIRFNIDHQLHSRVNIGLSTGYTISQNEGPDTGAIGPNTIASSSGTDVNAQYIGNQPLARLTYILPPNVPIYLPNGDYNINQTNGNVGYGPNDPALGVFNAYNLQTLLDYDKNKSASNALLGSIYAEVEIYRWLKFKTLYGLNDLRVENTSFRNPLSGDGFATNGLASNNTARYQRANWTNTLIFDETFQADHHLNVLLGHEYIKTDIAGWGATRTGMSDPSFTSFQGGWLNIVPANNIQTENAIISYFTNINYAYKSKYLISLNARRDGLSALADGNKWGNFGGGAVGWNVSEERFFKESTVSQSLNALKVRASYGVVGNSSLNDYAALSIYDAGTYAGSPTLRFTQAGNPDLQWESSKKFNIGLDLGFLNNRVLVSGEYYRNNVDNLILSAPQASSLGIPGNAVTANVGSLYNKGFEFTVQANILQKGVFRWSANANLSTLKNRVTSLGDGGDIYPTSLSTFGIQNMTREGYSVGSIFAVQTDGVNPDNGNRIFINRNDERVQYDALNRSFSYLDGSVAPQIDNYGDGRILGNSLPSYYGGVNSTMYYNNFDLLIGIIFSGGNKLHNGTRATLSDQRYFNNGTFILDRWTEPGQITDVPKVVWGDSFSNGFSSSISSNVEDGSFAKLKNVAIGYQVPLKENFARHHISSLRIYAQATNLLTITRYTGSDPEISINGNSINSGKDQNVPANAQVFSAGINIGF